MAILQYSGEKWLSCKILAEKLLSGNIQAEWTFILHDSGEKNCYRAGFWQKSVISQESGRNSVIEQDFGEKLLSCKILRDWTDILQDPDKKVSLKNSDRKNDYLALICLKTVSLLDSGRRKFTLQYSDRMKGYLARFWQKSVILQDSGKKMSFLENRGEIWLDCTIPTEHCSLSRFWHKNGYFAIFWLNERLSGKFLAKKGYLASLGQKSVVSQESEKNLVTE